MTEKNLLTPTQIVRSKRRTISLTIDRDGAFVVRAPINAKDVDIYDFINKKSKWIKAKRLAAINSAYKPLKFKDGEKVLILGKEYEIVLIDAKKVKVVDNQIFIPLNNSETYLKNYFVGLCKKLLPKRVERFCAAYGYKYKGISITSATTRWGSCSYNNHLNFTYKLIMCPRDVIDYLVVHELTHTKVKNHSAKFWQKVEEVLPNYKLQEKWLKENRKIIDVI